LSSLASFNESGREHVVATWKLKDKALKRSASFGLFACQGGLIADKTTATPGAWYFFRPSRTVRHWVNEDLDVIISQEHVFSEMMVSRGPRSTLTQGLDREVTKDNPVSGGDWV
jgi:hypothetical protein